MSRYGSQYQVGRQTGVCAASGAPLDAGTPCVATLCEREEDEGFDRLDFSIDAWQAGRRPPRLFSHWRTVVAAVEERRQLLVDDDVLEDLFDRLAADEREQRIAFRFVLALILMRKRRLRFVGRVEPGASRAVAADAGSTEVDRWRFRRRGSTPEDPEILVTNPRLSDDDVRDLTVELGEILQGDF
jgi:hypothetical protein